MIPQSLQSVFQLHEKFKRDEEVDENEQNMLATAMKANTELYSTEELETVDKIGEKINFSMFHAENADVTKLPSPDPKLSMSITRVTGERSPDPKLSMSITRVTGEPIGLLRCEMVVDAPFEQVSAFSFNDNSRQHISASDNDPDVLIRRIKQISAHAFEKLLVMHLRGHNRPRLFLTRHIWKRLSSHSIAIVCESIGSEKNCDLVKECDFPNYARVEIVSNCIYSRNGKDASSTKVNYCALLDFGGLFSSSMKSAGIQLMTTSCGEVCQHFQRDYEIDLKSRQEIMRYFDSADECFDFSNDELNDIKVCRTWIREFSGHDGPKTTFKTGNSCVAAVGYKMRESIFCNLSTTVKCSSSEALAFLLDIESRSLTGENDNNIKGGKKVLSEDGHTRFVRIMERTRREGFNGIELTCRKIVWCRNFDEIYCFMSPYNDTESGGEDMATQSAGRFLAQTILPTMRMFLRRESSRNRSMKRAMSARFSRKNTRQIEISVGLRIVSIGEDLSTVEMVVDLPSQKKGSKRSKEGLISSSEKRDVSNILENLFEYRMLSSMQHDFQRWRSPESLDESDGKVIGEALMNKSTSLFDSKERTAKARRDRLRLVVHEYTGMKILLTKEPWLLMMIETILVETETSFYVKMEKRTLSKLCLLTNQDGHTLGKSFLYHLSRAVTEEGCIQSLLEHHPALREFAGSHAFFKPLLTTIGGEIKHAETWHKLILSISSAAFSLFDVASDIFTIVYYRNVDLVEEANLITFFVSLSLGLQLMLVYVIHRHDSSALAREVLGTLTFTKPALNKWRVLTNAKVTGREMLNYVTEMMAFKLTEVFAESIPVTVLQVSTILTAQSINNIVLLAMLASVAFVAEGVTYLTFMKDISLEGRKSGKLFYGFAPLSGIRLHIVKIAMYMLSFCQLIGKSLAIAIIFQMGGRPLTAFVFSCEIGVYLLYKVLRGDFYHWLRLPTGFSTIMSLVERVAGKIVCDFTAMVHLRHPKEVGGFYWMLNMVYTQVSVFVALASIGEIDDSERAIKKRELWIIGVVLSLLWLLALFLLLRFSAPAYRHTFYNLLTTKQYNHLFFKDGDNRTRMKLITQSDRGSWRVFEDEVREWLTEVWGDLINEKPTWLTENLIAKIPQDLLPSIQYSEISGSRSGIQRVGLALKLLKTKTASLRVENFRTPKPTNE